MNSIQEYVCSIKGKKAGNYTYYASIIEHDGIPEGIALLLEYNIPSSTIKKIMKILPENLRDQELVDHILDNNLYENNTLIDYEKQLIVNNLISSKKA